MGKTRMHQPPALEAHHAPGCTEDTCDLPERPKRWRYRRVLRTRCDWWPEWDRKRYPRERAQRERARQWTRKDRRAANVMLTKAQEPEPYRPRHSAEYWC